MLDPRHLRIGNILLADPASIRYRIKKPYRVTQITVKGFTLDHHVDGASAEPIDLTFDVLSLCGFVDRANNGWGCRLSINSSDELCWYIQDAPEFGGLGNTVRYQTKGSGFSRDFNVKYLHQLQNLFFCLTGLELVIDHNEIGKI